MEKLVSNWTSLRLIEESLESLGQQNGHTSSSIGVGFQRFHEKISIMPKPQQIIDFHFLNCSASSSTSLQILDGQELTIDARTQSGESISVPSYIPVRHQRNVEHADKLFVFQSTSAYLCGKIRVSTKTAETIRVRAYLSSHEITSDFSGNRSNAMVELNVFTPASLDASTTTEALPWLPAPAIADWRTPISVAVGSFASFALMGGPSIIDTSTLTVQHEVEFTGK